MANIIPFNERIKAAVRVLRGRTFPRQSVIRIGEEKKLPLLWPDFRTGIAQWHVIDLANYIQEGFQGNSLIYSAIMYKARAQMQVPLMAYKGDPGQPELLPPNDPLAQLCARPNFHQSYPEMAMQAKVYFNVAGECFFFFDRPTAGGMPINILCLRPDRMHIVPAKNKKRLIGYVYTPENVPVSEGLRILPQDMMHVKLPNPGDPLEGMGHGLSPIAPMAKSADVDNDITDFLKLFFERGVMMPGILTTEMPLDDFTISRIRERWKEMYGGHQAWAEEIGVMDSNTKYQRIGLNFSEMGFDSLDERNEARILGPFGVAPELIATRLGTKASTYANKELARKQTWEDTLIPELTLFEREWQYYLQGDAGGWVAYDYSDVVALQEDKVALIAAAHQLWTMGAPANLAVAEVGLTMEPIPGGDIGYLPMGMLPTIGTASAALPAPTSTPVPDAEDEDRQDTTKKGASPSATSGGRSRLTEQVKQALAKKADVIAWKWTPAFTRTAREQFEIDHRELSAAVTAAGKKSIQEKATINWQWLQREWMEIFALAGERWREAFLPGIEGVMIEQGESLNLEFGVQWNVRNLFAEDWFTDYMGDFSKGIVSTTQDDMNTVLAQGMREGWSIPTTQKHLTQMFETWQGKVPKPGATWDWLEQRLPSNRTEMIARTETIRASARGSQGVYKGWGLNAKEWLTTEDDRLCDWCRAMDKKIIGIDDEYFGKGSVFTVPSGATGKPVSMRLNYEDVQGPPLHVNCVLPGNVVAVPGLAAGIKSFYDGRAIEIRTRLGYWATITENHPILTPDGWIAAKLLCEGDSVIVCTQPERIVSSINPDYEHVPAAIEEIFASLEVAPSMLAARVPITPVDLHTDGRFIDGDIDIVYPDGFLLGDGEATSAHSIGEHRFDNADARLVGLASEGALMTMFPGLLPATVGAMSSSDLGGPALRPHPAPLHKLGLRTPSRLNASALQTETKGVATDTGFPGDALLGLASDISGNQGIKVWDVKVMSELEARPGDVAPDRVAADTSLARKFLDRFASDIAIEQIVKVRKFDFRGHVYDLQSEMYGLYTVNGILNSNCRCALMPVIPEEGIEPEAGPEEVIMQAGGGAIAPTLGEAKVQQVTREDVLKHIMETNPPEQISAGRMSIEEWADKYLSTADDVYALIRMHPRAALLPIEAGDRAKVEEFIEEAPETAPAIVLDSNEKIEARYGGGQLDRAFGRQPYTVIDGKHRVEAALARGDVDIRAYVPQRKLEAIWEQSHSIELEEWALGYFADKGYPVIGRTGDGFMVERDGTQRTFTARGLERIARNLGHTWKWGE